MNIIILIFFGLVLAVFQTVHPPLYLPFICCYDLLIPYMIFCAFFRPLGQSLVAALVLGGMMDSLSGGPFGAYMSTYFWIFAAAVGLPRILKVNRVLVWCLACAGGVLAQEILFGGLFWASAQAGPDFLDMGHGMSRGVLGAAVSGWFIIWALCKACGRWDGWKKRSRPLGEPLPAKGME